MALYKVVDPDEKLPVLAVDGFDARLQFFIPLHMVSFSKGENIINLHGRRTETINTGNNTVPRTRIDISKQCQLSQGRRKRVSM